MEEMIYQQFIAGIVKKYDDEEYVLMDDLDKLNLVPEAFELVKRILNDRNIKLYLETPKDRKTRVSDFDYGEAKTLGMQSLDKPKFSTVDFDNDDTPAFEDFSKLEEYLVNVFIPNCQNIIKNYHGSGPFLSIQLNRLLDLKLSDIELAYAIDFLEGRGVKVRGKNSTIDEFENYQYLSNYHYTDLPPKMEYEEFMDLFKKYKETGDIEIRNKLIESNMRLVIMVALSVYKNCRLVELDDLISVGYEHLGEVIDRHNPEFGNKFSTFAVPSLRWHMIKEIEKNGRQVRVPSYLHQTIIKMKKVEKILEDELNRKPTIVEIASTMGLPVDKVYTLVSYDKAMEDIDKYDFPSAERSIEDKIVLGSLRGEMSEIIDTLTERESMVLKYRFGLTDGRAHSFEETAKLFGVSRERIRQIEAKALRKLRNPSRSKKLEDYYVSDFSNDKLSVETPDFVMAEDDMDDYSDGNHVDTIPDYFDEKKKSGR